ESRRTVERDQPQKDFSIAFGGKPLAPLLELAPQLAVIVNFAVEHHDVTAVDGGHRLRRLGPRIDDGETPVDQQHVAGRREPDAVAVGTAVRERAAKGGGQSARVAVNRPVPSHDASNATHYLLSRGAPPPLVDASACNACRRCMLAWPQAPFPFSRGPTFTHGAGAPPP